jgi:hypothetical protein
LPPAREQDDRADQQPAGWPVERAPFNVLIEDRSVQSRTPISLGFSVGLPSVTATGAMARAGEDVLEGRVA